MIILFGPIPKQIRFFLNLVLYLTRESECGVLLEPQTRFFEIN